MIHRRTRVCLRRQGERGFTLLEALVAMAIAAIAFTALYRAVGQSSKVVVDVEARAEAAMLARSVLASATFAEDLAPLQAGEDGRLQWRIQVTQQSVAMVNGTGQPLESGSVAAARVDVQVSRAGGGTVLELTSWKPYRTMP